MTLYKKKRQMFKRGVDAKRNAGTQTARLQKMPSILRRATKVSCNEWLMQIGHCVHDKLGKADVMNIVSVGKAVVIEEVSQLRFTV
jgi:hypothetical protein